MISEDAKAFFEKNQNERNPKVSKLEPFKADILFLKQKGMTEKKILEYLALKGVTVAQSGLNQFINKNALAPTTGKKVQQSKKYSSVSSPENVAAGSKPGAPPKKIDPAKPSWVPDHIDIDELLSKS